MMMRGTFGRQGSLTVDGMAIPRPHTIIRILALRSLNTYWVRLLHVEQRYRLSGSLNAKASKAAGTAAGAGACESNQGRGRGSRRGRPPTRHAERGPPVGGAARPLAISRRRFRTQGFLFERPSQSWVRGPGKRIPRRRDAIKWGARRGAAAPKRGGIGRRFQQKGSFVFPQTSALYGRGWVWNWP